MTRDERLPDPCELIPNCPVCLTEQMKYAKRSPDMDICVCLNCGMSMTVPHDAWQKRQSQTRA
jgi:hypothetical protein